MMGIGSDGFPKQIVRKFQIGDMIPPMPTMSELAGFFRQTPPKQVVCVEPGCNEKRCYSEGGHRYPRCREHQDIFAAKRAQAKLEKKKPMLAAVQPIQKKSRDVCCEPGCSEPRSVSSTGTIYTRCKKHWAERKRAANAATQARLRGK